MNGKRLLNLNRREFLVGSAGAGLLVLKGTPAQAHSGHWGTEGVGDSLEALRAAFLNPPAQAKPMTRWWWFGGAVTPEEISREMTFMRDAGIGGVEIQPVYPLYEDDAEAGIKNIAYYSEEWFASIRHAILEARRLGLRIDFTLGSGWPYGGPFVPLRLGARKLRFVTVDVQGPGQFSQWPEPGGIKDGEELIAAIAVRRESDSEEAPYSPGVQPLVLSLSAASGKERSVAEWPIPEGDWRVFGVIDAPTRMDVKRPTVGMEGYVIDHFSREALELFLKDAGDRVLEGLRDIPGVPFDSVFCDSLEVYGADWTSRLLERFREKRGYDLTPFLPALHTDTGREAELVRYDFHLTLSDLIAEDFFTVLVEWARSKGLKSRIQAHGAFGDVMRAYGLADVPEGENIFFGDSYKVNIRHRRLASSAAHVYRKPVVSAETYTWLRMPLFMVNLEMMKAATDAVFLDGINQIVNHGYSYSTPSAGDEGWSFYASTLINHNNTWWRQYPELAAYVRRAASVLRWGRQVNRVAIYLPLADVFAGFGSGGVHIDEEVEKNLGSEMVEGLRKGGYDFDFLNDESLLQLSSVERGTLKVGTGSYDVVVVPGMKFISVEALERIVSFAENGGSVVFVDPIPLRAPGLADNDKRTERIRDLLARIGCAAGKAVCGGSGLKVGRAADGKSVPSVLKGMLAPEMVIRRALPLYSNRRLGFDSDRAALSLARENVGFLRRETDEATAFFVSNLASESFDLSIEFNVGHRAPQLWRLDSGSIQESVAYRFLEKREGSGTEVQIDLQAFDSCLVVFGPAATPPVISRCSVPMGLTYEPGTDERKLSGVLLSGSAIEIEVPGGGLRRIETPSLPEPVVLDKGWQLQIPGRETVGLSQLASWTDLEEGTGFSGWARYELRFVLEGLDPDVLWELDLGQVYDTAEVSLNGVDLGASWKRPRRIDCTGAIKAGENHLEVNVANLWIHKVLASKPRDISGIEKKYGIRWGTYGEVPPETIPPAGLLGPVQLVPSRRVEIAL